METTRDGCLTERHFTLFGTIVHWMARHEVLIERIAAHVIGSQSSDVMLLTRDLTQGEKRLALLSLLRHRTVPYDQVDAISVICKFRRHSARWRAISCIQPGLRAVRPARSSPTGFCGPSRRSSRCTAERTGEPKISWRITTIRSNTAWISWPRPQRPCARIISCFSPTAAPSDLSAAAGKKSASRRRQRNLPLPHLFCWTPDRQRTTPQTRRG